MAVTLSFRSHHAGAATFAAVGLLASVLAACGGGSTATTAATSSAAGAQASASGQRTGARFDPAMQAKITQCLQAAGIAVPTFTRPPGMSSGVRPSFASGSPRPSGANRFADPKVRQALEACGITLPTRRPGASGAAGAAAAPTSAG